MNHFPFLTGGGEAASLIAAFDWTGTPLGPIPTWPAAMKSTVGMILRSHVPIVTLWGPEGVMIYNDAYSRFASGRHPRLLGSEVREGWPEVADFNDHVMRTVLAGESLSYKDRDLTLHRNGVPETVWMNLDYSPVLDDDGRPFGVMAIVVETTEKVLIDRWQRGEHERLRLMFEQSPGFMAMLRGPDHVFEFANTAYLRLVGPRDIQGRPVREALPEVEGQGFVALLDRVYETGIAHAGYAEPVSIQRAADEPAEHRYLDFVYQPVRDSGGAVMGIFVQGADVTSRVVAEAGLRSSETRNRQILDSAVDYGIIAFDLEGKVIRWNAGATGILGWSEAEMLGQDASRFFLPEDRAAGRPRLEMNVALLKGRARDERWHLRKSGERFWASGEMTPVRDDDGIAVGFVKVLRDRTAEHQAQLALARSEAQLRRAQEAGGVGVFTFDIAADVINGTPEFCRIFGLVECAVMPAQAARDLVFPEDLDTTWPQRGDHAEKTQHDIEYRIRRANDGEVRVIARKAEIERDETGAPVRMVGVVQDVTERRWIQRQLEESGQMFRTFAQAMPNQVWSGQANGRLDWFNDRVYEYSGTQRDDVDEGWTGIVHPEDRAEAMQRWSAALASGETYEVEFRLRRADGVYRWHLARALPIRASDGTITRWVGTNTDIHEQKLAGAESARDRDRLWTMSQDLMLVCDFGGVITAVNPSARRLLGWSEDEMLGQAVSAFIHPDDIEGTAREMARLESGAATLAFENRYRTKLGAYRLLDWTAVPDGDRIHAVGRDITETRAIARDQERIWNVSPVLKVVARADGAIEKINPAWTMTLGWTLDDSVGRRLSEFIAEEDWNALLDATSSAPKEVVRDHELTTRTKSSGTRRIAWSFVLEGPSLFGFGRDVSEQRHAEDALRQSQKMEAVGQLTGGIAHDFNNLLQGITGGLDLVKRRVASGRFGDLDRLIAGAMASANRAAALTHRLLAFSRRQPLDPRPVQVNPLVVSMEDLLRRTLGESVELILTLDPGLWVTKCDPNQLESAILNLVINARDAMPDGGRLVIQTSNEVLARSPDHDARPGDFVRLAVSDTGTGMDEETIERAFEPFFTTKPIGQGTGLGLSMIYGFVRQSEGHSTIDSTLGRGTTVTLYLPRFVGEVHHGVATPAFEPPLAQTGEVVLVIEDDLVVKNLIVDVLNELGYRAIEAGTGVEGLATLQSDTRIDLLITDVGLPGLNGRQVADAARVLRPGLKVLFMTGYAENATTASGFLEPGMELLTKPFAMETLALRVRAMLEPDEHAAPSARSGLAS